MDKQSSKQLLPELKEKTDILMQAFTTIGAAAKGREQDLVNLALKIVNFHERDPIPVEISLRERIQEDEPVLGSVETRGKEAQKLGSKSRSKFEREQHRIQWNGEPIDISMGRGKRNGGSKGVIGSHG